MRQPTAGRVFVVTIATVLQMGCRATADRPGDRGQLAASIQEMAFEALRTGNIALVDRICLTPQDLLALGELRAKMSGQPFDRHKFSDRASELSSRAREKVRASFKRLLRMTRESGFEWDKAVLERATVGHESGRIPGLPGGQAMEVDIYLHIGSGDRTIVVELDECFLVGAVRRTRDGFRFGN